MYFHQPELNRPVRILAIDDLPDNLELIEAILDGQGYEVKCLSDGPSALDYIQTSPPDLVLLDVMMPGMDGYEVARRLRQDEHLPYIPILLITADDQSNVVRGLDAGADDFIRKPVDIDELLARVRSLLRLKHSIDELHTILRQRDDFVARLTHDLRTPLVAANRVLQFCIDGAFGSVGEDLKMALSNMLQNNQNLLQMANTLLEVYRHEAGQKTIALSRVNLLSLAEEVVSELTPLAVEKQLALKLNIPDEADIYWVRGDQLELRRVLTNIIGNAIKFTDQGSITVQFNQTDTPCFSESESVVQKAKLGTIKPSDRWIELSVTDTGPGMSSRDRAHVFDWYRPGKHRNSSSGLGLHLSQRIARLHGGIITVESEAGEGSTFTLSLPAKAVKSSNFSHALSLNGRRSRA